MIDQGKFGPAEAVVLLTFSMSARIFLTFPSAMISFGANAAWMSSLGGMLVALAGVCVMGRVLARYPGKTIIQATEDILGPYLGSAVNLIYVIFFISVAVLFTRQFSEAMIIAALPFTPISVITMGFLSVSILGAYLGIEAMARGARLVYPFIVIGVIMLLLGLYPLWNFNNLFPVLGMGPREVFVEGGFSAAAITEIILAGLIVQYFGGHQMFNKVGYRMVLLGFGFLSLMLLVTALSFLWPVSEEYNLPFYTLAKTIYLSRFFQRIEAIYILIWSFIGLLKIALTLYAAAVSLVMIFKLPDHRPLLWPLALVIFIGSLLPPDMPSAVKLDITLLRPGAWLPNYIIPLLLLLAIWIKGRIRGAN